jgi:hypothetical protein
MKLDWNTVLWAFSILTQLALILWVAPLRKLREEIEILRAKNYDEKLREHKARIIALEENEKACRAELPARFATKDDINRSELHRDGQLEVINDKLDAVSVATAALKAVADATQKQVDTIFRLWNEEHKRP